MIVKNDFSRWAQCDVLSQADSYWMWCYLLWKCREYIDNLFSFGQWSPMDHHLSTSTRLIEYRLDSAIPINNAYPLKLQNISWDQAGWLCCKIQRRLMKVSNPWVHLKADKTSYLFNDCVVWSHIKDIKEKIYRHSLAVLYKNSTLFETCETLDFWQWRACPILFW